MTAVSAWAEKWTIASCVNILSQDEAVVRNIGIGLTCMCVMRFSSDKLWYKQINVTRVQHLNLCTHSSYQHYTGQLKSAIIYSFYYLFTYKLFQFGGRMFQDGDLKTWTSLETKLETWSEIYRNELEMKRTRSQGHAIIFS